MEQRRCMSNATSILKRLVSGVLALGMGTSLALAVDLYPYFDPKEDGFNIKNDDRPWFDGKDYPFYRDMYDGKSLKPQEEGTYQEFPEQSIPVRMVLGKLVPIYDPFIPSVAGDGSGPDGHPREFYPKNPTQGTPASIQRGQVLFNTYCAACHGADGLANTVAVQKGVPAPPLVAFFKMPTAESHLYNKIKYGSFYQTPRGLMPAFGAQTSVQDRWDMVNYMVSDQFGKEIQ
jgi:mono/diheme cytochrome c family protein